MTFLLLDAQSLWGEDMPAKKRSKAALLAGANRVARAVGLDANLDLHFMGVTSGKMGRYFCAQCNMFFEYGQQQAQVTCPFMSQKCKFRPKPLPEALASSNHEGETFSLDILTKIYQVSPKLYRRNLKTAIESAPDTANGPVHFRGPFGFGVIISRSAPAGPLGSAFAVSAPASTKPICLCVPSQ